MWLGNYIPHRFHLILLQAPLWSHAKNNRMLQHKKRLFDTTNLQQYFLYKQELVRSQNSKLTPLYKQKYCSGWKSKMEKML